MILWYSMDFLKQNSTISTHYPMIHYTPTYTIINNLEQIHSVWGVIINAKIVPEWEQKLLKIARLRSGVFSTRIEGNQMSLEEAEKFLEGKPIKARERDKKELKNYMSVLEYIEQKASDKSITEKHILEIHALVTKDILSKGLQNQYREQQNAIYDQKGGLVYMPPEWKEVSKFMKQLLEYINQETEISPLIRAALLHHWFVIIHPFVDGNGRTARTLTQMFLYQNGFDTKKYFSLEEYYDTDLNNYYKAIHIRNNYYETFEQQIDSTSFVEYFLTGMNFELTRLKTQIKHIKDEENLEQRLAEKELTNRQIHFVLFVKEKGQAKSQDFLDKFHVSLATVKRELQILVEKEVILSISKGKNTHYELNMNRI